MDERAFFERADRVLAPRRWNDAQRAAVRGGEGPLGVPPRPGPILVEAGPGSGKTTVLVWRIVYMLRVLGVSPRRIAVVTFTKAAADDMRRRLARLTRDAAGMHIGTMHRLARSLLEEWGAPPGRTLNEPLQLEAAREVLRACKVPLNGDAPAQFLSELTALRNRMQSPEDHRLIHVRSGPLKERDTFVRAARTYLEGVRHGPASDFDGWLERLLALLEARPDGLAGRFDHILVDEFQDTSLLQYALLRRLAEPDGLLYAVGDEDQSIYSWRGAGPEVFRRFVRDEPDAIRIVLDVNYRATPKLVEATNRLIEHNPVRRPKRMEAATEDGPEEPLFVLRPRNDGEEARLVGQRLLELREEGVPWREMAVLYRFNEQSLAFIARFGRFGIPFRILGGPPNPFRSWVGRDLLAYVRLARGERDPRLLEQIIYRPNRYVSKEATRAAAAKFRQGASLTEAFALADLNEAQRSRIQELEHDLARVGRMAPAEAVHCIRTVIGYDEYVLERAAEGGGDGSDGLANAVLVETAAGAFDRLDSFIAFAEAVGRESRGWWRGFGGSYGANGPGPGDGGVTLTTCHSAKGLEFDVVAVAGLVDGVLPAEDGDVEEERRLAYVAMTRARRMLMLSAPGQLLGEARTPSRFAAEATGMEFSPKKFEAGSPLASEAVGRSAEADGGPGDASASGASGRVLSATRSALRVPDPERLTEMAAAFPVGTKVRHTAFGDGRVTGVDPEDGLVVVQFGKVGEKRLGLALCVEKSLLRRLA